MRHLLLLIILAIGLAFALPVQSAESLSEAKLKAAYLYNFVKFIHWPEESFVDEHSPLIIGVLGENPFRNDELTPLSTRTVRNRTIEIRQFAKMENVENCHLLYISPAITETLRSVLKNFSIRPIVTVGDHKDFTTLGGVIQFVTRRDRLRFRVSLTVARENSIKIDSQLLALAVEVTGGSK